MTTKRWGSRAMRENSVTSSRNLGRHSESIIQPGAEPGAIRARSRVTPGPVRSLSPCPLPVHFTMIM